MNCEFCGSPMPEDSVFCPNCGKQRTVQAQEGGMFCPNCGIELFAEDKCCPECGMPVNNQSFEMQNMYNDGMSSQNMYNDTYNDGMSSQNMYNDTYNGGNAVSYGGNTNTPKSKTGLIIAIIAAAAAVAIAVTAFLMWDDIMGWISGDSDAPAVSETLKPDGKERTTEEPDETQEPENATEEPEEDGDDYILDTKRISSSDLDGLSQSEVRLMLNEMYARHGFIFSQQENIEYFSKQSWYIPRTSDQDEVLRDFNSIEMDNRKTITDYEYEHGWRASRV